MAALSASSEIATAWWRSSRGRRATSTSHVWIASSSSIVTGWKRRSRAGSARIHLSYSSPVVAPITRMSPRTSAGFSMLAASIAAPIAVPCPIKLCSSSTNRIKLRSVSSAFTRRRMRSSYWPRNDVLALKDARILELDHVSMLAGTSFRGQYEEGIRRLVKALETDRNLILFVDELHNLMGQGTAMGAAMDAANMLKPALVRGDMRVIGATTGEEYDKWIRADPALERRFQPVTIEELDAIQTWEVLVARRPRFERHHAVAIADDALKAAIVLTDRFVPERARPDKAIDVLDEACAHAQATAHVSPELDKLIRDRKKVEALIRRGLTEEEGSAPEEPMPDLATVLQRFGEEIEELLGGRRRSKADEGGRREEPPSPAPDSSRPPSLEQQRAELDQKLRAELERQGLVVSGKEVARVVASAVGKGIEWVG